MDAWHLPWKYIMVMDFGAGEPTGYTCAHCGVQAVRYAILLTDSGLKKFYFDLQCAARIIGPEPDSETMLRRMDKLRNLGNKGSLRIGPDILNP